LSEQELAWIREQFARCRPWIQAALDRCPIKSHTAEHVLETLERGEAQIWPSPNSCVVATISTYPTGLKTFNVWLGGGDLKELMVLCEQTQVYAKSIGCDLATITGRKGWLKAIPGTREAVTTLIKELA
jgi:hypothetical protein